MTKGGFHICDFCGQNNSQVKHMFWEHLRDRDICDECVEAAALALRTVQHGITEYESWFK